MWFGFTVGVAVIIAVVGVCRWRLPVAFAVGAAVGRAVGVGGAVVGGVAPAVELGRVLGCCGRWQSTRALGHGPLLEWLE